MVNGLVTLSAAALLVALPGTMAFETPCVYQEYKCGYNMVANHGYTVPELTAAVNMTDPIPPISDTQLLQVLYRCTDVAGTAVGNSFCFAGCINMGNATTNDMCAM